MHDVERLFRCVFFFLYQKTTAWPLETYIIFYCIFLCHILPPFGVFSDFAASLDLYINYYTACLLDGYWFMVCFVFVLFYYFSHLVVLFAFSC